MYNFFILILFQVKVCVIGCGISGAAAAGELVAAGMKDVIVLEAAGRYGGRVHTIKHGKCGQSVC
jgi:monoamine oxidase